MSSDVDKLAFNMNPDKKEVQSLERKYGVTRKQARHLAILNDFGFNNFQAMQIQGQRAQGMDLATKAQGQFLAPLNPDDMAETLRDEARQGLREGIIQNSERDGAILGRDYTEADLQKAIDEEMADPAYIAQLEADIRSAVQVMEQMSDQKSKPSYDDDGRPLIN